MIYGDHKVVKYMAVIFMYFSPRISLLTLRCFVAEVRWLFPVNHQEYWESTKQKNIEPWWELNKKSVLRAHHSNSAEYLTVNLLFLYIVCLVLIVSYSIYGNYFANCLQFICLRARSTETGSKGWTFQTQWQIKFSAKANLFPWLCLLSLCVPYNSSLFLSFPVRQKLLDVGKKNCLKSKLLSVTSAAAKNVLNFFNKCLFV